MVKNFSVQFSAVSETALRVEGYQASPQCPR